VLASGSWCRFGSRTAWRIRCGGSRHPSGANDVAGSVRAATRPSGAGERGRSRHTGWQPVSRARACRQRAMRHRGEQTRWGGCPSGGGRRLCTGAYVRQAAWRQAWGEAKPIAGADAGPGGRGGDAGGAGGRTVPGQARGAPVSVADAAPHIFRTRSKSAHGDARLARYAGFPNRGEAARLSWPQARWGGAGRASGPGPHPSGGLRVGPRSKSERRPRYLPATVEICSMFHLHRDVQAVVTGQGDRLIRRRLKEAASAGRGRAMTKRKQ
jgi:hypothetical protein